MSGRSRGGLRLCVSLVRWLACGGLFFAVLTSFFAPNFARAQQRREREPNSVYAERRAKLISNLDGPIILFGFTGKEEEGQTYVFTQEENFYYLTGHNEEDAVMVILPPDGSAAKKDDWPGPREML